MAVAFFIVWMRMQLRKREHQIVSAVAVIVVAAIVVIIVIINGICTLSTSCQARDSNVTPAAAEGCSPGDGGGVGATPWSSNDNYRLSN